MKVSSSKIKDKIVSATIELIHNSNGNLSTVTTRAIARSANVGVGLINYHFQTKAKLIDICVQRIIEQTIENFQPKTTSEQTGIDLLIGRGREVFDYLFENKMISSISILDDFHKPTPTNNTMKTVAGFTKSLADCDMTDQQKKRLVFLFTSMLQNAFLYRTISKQCFGYDLMNKHERNQYVYDIAMMLYKGAQLGEYTQEQEKYD